MEQYRKDEKDTHPLETKQTRYTSVDEIKTGLLSTMIAQKQKQDDTIKNEETMEQKEKDYEMAIMTKQMGARHKRYPSVDEMKQRQLTPLLVKKEINNETRVLIKCHLCSETLDTNDDFESHMKIKHQDHIELASFKK